MLQFVDQLRSALAKRRAFQRTISEIEAMNLDTALDLDIYRGDAREIAYKAVYGR